MLLKIDLQDSTPVYAQIVAQVKNAIASGVLRPGEFLPSLRDTALALRINPHTVAKAYRELEFLGLVRTDHGRGTYVTADVPALPRQIRKEQLARLCEQLAIEAYHLGATPAETVEMVNRKLSDLAKQSKQRESGKREERGG